MILLLRRAAAQKVAPFSQFLFIVLVIGLVGCSIGTSPPAPQLSVPQWQSDRTALLWLRGSMSRSQDYNMQVVGTIEPRQ